MSSIRPQRSLLQLSPRPSSSSRPGPTRLISLLQSRLGYLLLGLGLTASLWGALPRPVAAQPWSVWQLTQVKDGHFSILMPGESDRTTQPLTILGTSAEKTVVSAEQWQHQAEYRVGWTDLPQQLNLSNARQQAFVFEEMLSQLSLELGGQLMSETDLKLAGHPGKQYQLSGWIDGEPHHISYRAFLIGSRFFQVSVAMPERSAPGLAGSTRGFLRSFRLQ